MNRPEKRVTLAQDAGRLMRILEMEVVYTEGSSSLEAEGKNLLAKLAVSENALVEKGKALKLSEEESGKLSEERRVLLAERESLQGKVVALIAELVPAKDELDDTKDLKTLAELADHFQLAVDDAQATSEGSFDNVVSQMNVLNPGVELNTSVIGVNYYVADGQILVPDYLRDIVDQTTRDPARLSPIVEGEAEG